MTPEQAEKAAITRLNEMQAGDNEAQHGEADMILIEILRRWGHDKLADAWEQADSRVRFWYS